MTQYSMTPPNIDPSATSGTALASNLSSWNTAINTTHQGDTAPTYAATGMAWAGKNGRLNQKLSSGDYIVGHRPITSITDLRNFGEGQLDSDLVRVQIGTDLFTYYWDADSVEADDGSTVILPSGWTEAGRWLRFPVSAGGNAGWTLEEASVAYVSAEALEVYGDRTAIYVKDRALKLDQTTDAIVYVESSALDIGGNTVVQVRGGDVDSGLADVSYGIEPYVQSDLDFSGLAEVTDPTTGDWLLIERDGVKSKVDAAGLGGGGIAADEVNTFTAAQIGAVVSLTDAATIAVDLALANNFEVTVAGSRTLGLPTNIAVGQSGVIYVGKAGTYTMAFNAVYRFPGGVTPTLTEGATRDMIAYYVQASDRIVCTFIPNV